MAADVTTQPRTPARKFKAARGLKNLIEGYGMACLEADRVQQPTAWITAGAPVEVLYTQDVFPLHPENAACVAGAGKISLPYIEEAESQGFSRDLCSYFKTNVGATTLLTQNGYITNQADLTKGAISKPTMMIPGGAICDTHVKWFQTQARRMNVPIFPIDVPHLVSGEDDRMDDYADYVEAQMWDLTEFIEKHTGNAFDKQKFEEVLRRSDELCEYWHKIYELRKNIPCPVGFMDTLAAIFPLVVLPGIRHPVINPILFYKRFFKEAEQRVADGYGAIENEQYRLLFEGIPFWYAIRFIRMVESYNAVICFEPYTLAFGPRKPVGTGIHDIAKIMIHHFYNLNLETRVKEFSRVINEWHIDGCLLHNNLSCRPSATGMYDLKERLMQETGTPSLILDCDMNDPRAYSDEQMRMRIESFLEVLKENKQTR
ncbi:MAG TPA: 2-hydroxyacyl-CoA dehydratase family protein [Candidatus Lokiarchaeia archaeon]|nr:2-hydroxyacyl-CoA dehydratase family protein [Candidatus Lokiarchaeia archaeon]